MDGARLGPRRARRAIGALAAWSPVWIPLLVLVQLVWLGTLPTRAERARLDQAEAEVRGRVERLRREEQVHARDSRRLADEVYRERVRRSLLDPLAAPLTLEGEQAGARP
jgi:hypothetical protein